MFIRWNLKNNILNIKTKNVTTISLIKFNWKFNEIVNWINSISIIFKLNWIWKVHFWNCPICFIGLFQSVGQNMPLKTYCHCIFVLPYSVLRLGYNKSAGSFCSPAFSKYHSMWRAVCPHCLVKFNKTPDPSSSI